MSVVTATAAASATLIARISITVTGAAVGETMTLYRLQDGALTPVMGVAGIPATARVIVDGEVPLNRPVAYRVVTSTGAQATSGTVTVTGHWAVVSDPVRGIRAEVAVLDRDEVSRRTRVTVLEVEGDPEPWLVRDVPGARQTPVQLYSLTDAAATAMEALLAAGGPLLLRCVCGHHPDLWIEPFGTVAGGRVVRRPDATSRMWDLGTCVIYGANPVAGQLARGNTLGMVDAAVGHSTLGAIAAQWPTLGAIAIADLGV